MIASSPPYWMLRDYGVPGQLGQEPLHDCLAWAKGGRPCAGCFVCAIRMIAAEAGRVLRNDGTLWLNLGDSYVSTGGGMQGETGQRQGRANTTHQRRGIAPAGLPAKNLVGVPWRVALALQADGWILRSEIVWRKTNAMPASVTDRPTSSHEHIFLLARAEHYFYDADAVRTPYKDTTLGRLSRSSPLIGGTKSGEYGNRTYSGSPWSGESGGGANLRDVWDIPTQSYPGNHFAAWPEALVEIMVRAGTSERGVCTSCAAPFVRVVKRGKAQASKSNPNEVLPYSAESGHLNGTGATTLHKQRPRRTLGWRPSCGCYDAPAWPHKTGVKLDQLDDEQAEAAGPLLAIYAALPTNPAVVLDPFAGSGTTGLVARRLGRRAILCDLNHQYLLEEAGNRLGLHDLVAWQHGRGVQAEGELAGLPLLDALKKVENV